MFRWNCSLQDLQRDEPVNWTNWKGGDGQEGDNCAFIFTDSVKYGRSVSRELDYSHLLQHLFKRWGDSRCTTKSPVRVCTICNFPVSKMKYSLRGLCQESRQDRNFSLETRKEPDKPYFKGISSTIIQWVGVGR